MSFGCVKTFDGGGGGGGEVRYFDVFLPKIRTTDN